MRNGLIEGYPVQSINSYWIKFNGSQIILITIDQH